MSDKVSLDYGNTKGTLRESMGIPNHSCANNTDGPIPGMVSVARKVVVSE